MLARENDEVDDGWLCDKGRFAYQSVHIDERVTAPLIRDGGRTSRGQLGARAERGRECATARGHTRRGARGRRGDERGGAPAGRLMREAIGSGDIDSRPTGAVALDDWRALAAPGLAAKVSDLEFAHAVLVLDCEPLDDAPILELWIRKGVRRHGVSLAVAGDRPSALDANAERSCASLRDVARNSPRRWRQRCAGRRLRPTWRRLAAAPRQFASWLTSCAARARRL